MKKDEVSIGEKYIYILRCADGEHCVSLVQIKECRNNCAIACFEEVYKDHSGNGYFRFLKRTGHTMAVSYEYLEKLDDGAVCK